jgi:hypothetical protein
MFYVLCLVMFLCIYNKFMYFILIFLNLSFKSMSEIMQTNRGWISSRKKQKQQKIIKKPKTKNIFIMGFKENSWTDFTLVISSHVFLLQKDEVWCQNPSA